MKANCSLIILAGGASTRLGEPKQLLLHRQKTLLAASISAAVSSLAAEIIVVLGANAHTINASITEKKLVVLINESWQEGMASSIRCGLLHLLAQKPGPDSVLFMVCDQPYINADIINKLITLQQETATPVVASHYAGITGIPAVFGKEMFPALLQLKGDSGARKLIMQYKVIPTVAFPSGEVDIDTAADYARLQNKEVF